MWKKYIFIASCVSKPRDFFATRLIFFRVKFAWRSKSARRKISVHNYRLLSLFISRSNLEMERPSPPGPKMPASHEMAQKHKKGKKGEERKRKTCKGKKICKGDNTLAHLFLLFLPGGVQETLPLPFLLRCHVSVPVGFHVVHPLARVRVSRSFKRKRQSVCHTTLRSPVATGRNSEWVKQRERERAAANVSRSGREECSIEIDTCLLGVRSFGDSDACTG